MRAKHLVNKLTSTKEALEKLRSKIVQKLILGELDLAAHDKKLGPVIQISPANLEDLKKGKLPSWIEDQLDAADSDSELTKEEKVQKIKEVTNWFTGKPGQAFIDKIIKERIADPTGNSIEDGAVKQNEILTRLNQKEVEIKQEIFQAVPELRYSEGFRNQDSYSEMDRKRTEVRRRIHADPQREAIYQEYLAFQKAGAKTHKKVQQIDLNNLTPAQQQILFSLAS